MTTSGHGPVDWGASEASHDHGSAEGDTADATKRMTTADDPHAVADESVARVLAATLAYARERDYTGWDYFDGMSSRIRQWLPGENKWVNIAIQEGIKRAPVNVRRLMLVEQRQNFKGTALFAVANQAAGDYHCDERYHREVDRLSNWLVENQTRGYAGFCGGHQHATQGLHDRLPAKHPGIVSTGYAVRALLAAARRDESYAAIADSALPFVFEELNYRESSDGARIDYHASVEAGETVVVNANAIGARLLLDLHDHRHRPRLRERAERILDYVAGQQTALGGWMYTDPPSASHLSMDNHHNGFILESFLRHREVTGSDRYAETLERGMAFYRETLFEESGAPNWDEESRYPRDIHAAAQGIVLFSVAGDTAFASRIIDWTLSELYAGNGRFSYQKRRFYTKKVTLMRWCQAWMAFALGQYLAARRRASTET